MDRKKLIRNEQIVRNHNRTASRALKKYFGRKKDVTEEPVAFICECSDLDCHEPVTVTIAEYEKLHQRNDRFLIVKGHKTPEIERTIERKGGLELVEKPDLPA